MKKVPRVGVLGGSFNPIHQGHLKLASYALSELNLDQVIFVPSYQTPLKEKTSLLPVELRVSLLKKAIRGKTGFSVSLCEIRRKGLSYTVDTLGELKKMFSRETVFFFLTGADTLSALHRWKSFDKILKLCRFVVMSRPGYSLGKLPPGVEALPFDAIEVSSSKIRKSLEEGGNITGWAVPGTENLLKRYFKDRQKEKLSSKPRKK